MDKREGIAAILMLKDENRMILHEDGSKPDPPYTMLEQCLRRLKSLVQDVYVVDNASTDGSHKIYDKYKDNLIKYILYNPADVPFDDVRDRKILLERAKKNGMNWIIVVDGDEILEDKADSFIHEYVSKHDPAKHWALKFHYVNIWRGADRNPPSMFGRTRYRTDMWNSSWFIRMFSVPDLVLTGTALHNYAFKFRDKNSGELSGGNVDDAPVKVLHYGWADWNHRIKKTKRYIERDMELNYRSYEMTKHIYSNDLNEHGIKLAEADPSWASEFRTGKIDY